MTAAAPRGRIGGRPETAAASRSSSSASPSASAPVQANRDIDLAVAAGTIHGIVGENGAGKSTLMSILYGFYQADAGEIRVDGTADAASPTATRRDRGRHRHGPPALHAGRAVHRARERHARRRGRARCSRPSLAKARAELTRLARGLRARRRSRRHRRRALGRPPAARRDPQGALPRRRHPDPRRADRRADAGRGRPPVPHPRSTSRPRARRSSSSPTSCARSWR